MPDLRISGYKQFIITVSIFFVFLCFTQNILIAQDKDAEILQYDTRVDFSGDKLITEYKTIIQINNPKGDVYSYISIPYSSMVSVYDIQGLVKDEEGNIVQRLDEEKIVSVHAGSEETFYDDQMVYYFLLKHRKFPYTIEYSYKTTQEEYLHLIDWSPLLSYEIPTHSASLEINIPEHIKYRVLEKNIDPAIEEDSPSGKKFYWESAYTELLKNEVYSPPLIELTPSVSVIPEKFYFDIDGYTRNWQEFGDWIYKLTEGKQDLPEDVSREILATIDNLSDTLEIIETLYHKMQDETRYVFIAIETGGLKPYSAEYVSKNHFGDCKALSNYFRAVLQVAGIESYYTLVNSGMEISRINMDYPSQQFNHVILMVPYKNDSLWVDCTSDGAFAFAGSMIQNRKALVVDRGKSHFAEIPMLSEKEVLNSRKISIHNVGDTVYADFSCNYKGGLYEFFLLLKKNAGTTSLRNLIRNLITEPDFDLLDYNIESFHRDSANIDFSYSAKSIDYYLTIKDEIHFSPLTLHGPVFNPPGERKNPVQISNPFYLSDTLEYFLPEQTEILHLPSDTLIQTDYGYYSFVIENAGDRLIIVKDFLINPGDYTIDEYTAFYAFIEKVMRAELFHKIILKKNSLDEDEI